MDVNQLARMIEWLDEERRRDKTTIAQLEERLAQQQQNVDTLLRRVNSLESDQSTMRTQFVPSGRDADVMDTLRKEMKDLIDAIEARRLNAEREAERRNEIARENLARQLHELPERIAGLERRFAEIPALQSDRDRVSGSLHVVQQRVDDMLKKLEEPERRIAFLEEQRRQDSRRISEIQSETPELQKKIDGIRPKLDLLEDMTLRNERRIQEMQTIEADRREQIQQFIDQQSLLLQERDQQVNDLIKRFSEHDGAMQSNIERFETWETAYRSMKQIIDDFERIGDRLERRINEVAEMQRLSEERFRQEWNDWSSDDQKRWKQFTLSNDEVWRVHDKEFERFVQRFEAFEAKLPPLQDSVVRIWKLERERARLYREGYQALLLEYDTTSTATGPLPVVNGVHGD